MTKENKALKRKIYTIMASSRGDGDTLSLCKCALSDIKHKFVNLAEKQIDFFRYGFDYDQDDQFIEIIEEMIEYDTIILATPVYWYTMSAQMKIFFDRLSDLITLRKDLGRRLKGKKVYVMATYGATMPISFEEPFRQTCIYLEMEYSGCLYFYTGKHGNMAAFNNERVENFRKLLSI